MAALADLAPATGSVNILPDAPVTFRITNGTDIDLALVELTIGAQSCTVANGLLLPWNTRDASGATVVDNLTDVHFTSTGLRWYTGSVEVTAEVIYDSGSLGTATWTASEDDNAMASAVGTIETYATSRTSDEATVTGFYHVQIQSLLTTLDGSFAVQEWALGMHFDGRYWVAHPYYTDALASGVVALPYLYDHLASGAIHGYAFEDHLAQRRRPRLLHRRRAGLGCRRDPVPVRPPRLRCRRRRAHERSPRLRSGLRSPPPDRPRRSRRRRDDLPGAARGRHHVLMSTIVSYLTAYMGQSDVTSWVTSARYTQAARTYFDEVALTFAGGWDALDTAARWDIYGSHDVTNPRAELIIRAGIVPPDRPREAMLSRTASPTISITVVAAGWILQRISPRETLVLLPALVAGRRPDPREALSRYAGVVGRWATVQPLDTAAAAVAFVAGMAGCRVDWRLTDWRFTPYVWPPDRSAWATILEICRGAHPEYSYNAVDNVLAISPPTDEAFPVGPVMELPVSLIRDATALPVKTKRFKRLSVRFQR